MLAVFLANDLRVEESAGTGDMISRGGCGVAWETTHMYCVIEFFSLPPKES